MGKVRKYNSDWQHETFTCGQCGWTGKVGHEDLEAGDVAAIIECPKCYRSVGVVLYPNLDETKEAAATGNAEAIRALPSFAARIERNRELLDRFEKQKIRSADQLPNLDHESLEFDWDFVKGADGERYQVIRTGERGGLAGTRVLQQHPAFRGNQRTAQGQVRDEVQESYTHADQHGVAERR